VLLNEREVVPTEWIRSPVAAVIHRDGFEVTGGGRFFTSDSRYEESEHPPSRMGTWCAWVEAAVCDMSCSDMMSILVVLGLLVSVFNKLSLSIVAFNKLVQVLSLLSKDEMTLLDTELQE